MTKVILFIENNSAHYLFYRNVDFVSVVGDNGEKSQVFSCNQFSIWKLLIKTVSLIQKNIMKKVRLLFLSFILFNQILFSQSFTISKIEPSNWWKGMKTEKIQIMIYGEHLNDVEVASSDLNITEVHKVENHSYLFIDIDLAGIEIGDYRLTFSNLNNNIDITFPILKREESKIEHQGFDNTDVIYLIMPDRFSNGDPTNDQIDGYLDEYQDQYTQARHGGDLQGVINRLDYLKNLGVTTLWLTPVVENNTFRSYHGYSATDFYSIDPRLGDLELYKTFINAAHSKGLKVIMDHVSNHISIDHPWMLNLPTPDWINGSVNEHLDANHNKMVYTDPYADSSTIYEVYKGWFVPYMPDLNQANPFLGNYIIQNTLWWLETTGVDGIREDTYPYCNQEFMSKWAKTIMSEYPRFNIVGEVWTGEPAFLSGYQAKNKLTQDESNLKTITDFGMRDVIVDFLGDKNKINDLYYLLAKDYLYPDSKNLLTFIDNHDVGRAMFQANSDVDRFKIAFFILLTTRGIPQIFYGTEIGMIENEDHGTLRKNFPGGFPGDERNAFISSGRTEYENDIFDFLQRIITIRKKYSSLSTGKLIHFPVKNEVYIYFRSSENEMIMNIINTSNKSVEIDLSKFKHIIKENIILTNLLESEQVEVDYNTHLKVCAMRAKMFLVK